MKKQLLSTAFVVAGMMAAGSAMAAPAIYNLSLPDISTFDSVITGTGSTVTTAQVVNGESSYGYTDNNGDAATVTVTRNNSGGTAALPSGGYTSGYVVLCPVAFGTSTRVLAMTWRATSPALVAV